MRRSSTSARRKVSAKPRRSYKEHWPESERVFCSLAYPSQEDRKMKFTFAIGTTLGLALSAFGQININPVEVFRGAADKQTERHASPNDPRMLLSWNVTLEGAANG